MARVLQMVHIRHQHNHHGHSGIQAFVPTGHRRLYPGVADIGVTVYPGGSLLQVGVARKSLASQAFIKQFVKMFLLTLRLFLASGTLV